MENGSRHPYVPRAFYGPFEGPEKTPVKSKRPDSELYIHPEDRGKLVRYERDAFGDRQQMEQDVSDMRELLAWFDEHSIRHVKPEYFDATPEGKRVSPVLGMTVDYIKHTDTLGDLINNDERVLTDDEIDEIDQTATYLCAYVVDIETKGGVISFDCLKLHQFVYASEAKKGERSVLVDVEPIGLVRLQPGEYMDDFTTFVIELVSEIAKLKQKSRNKTLVCTTMADEMIAQISNATPAVDELRVALSELMYAGMEDRINDYFLTHMEHTFIEEDES